MSSENLPQQIFEMLSANILVAYSNDSVTCSCQELGTCAVVDLLSCFVVRTSLKLDRDAFARTVKIDNESMQYVLPPKFQPQDCAIAQQSPRMTFRRRRSMAQLACERESLRWSQPAKRIHIVRNAIEMASSDNQIAAGLTISPPSPERRGGQGVRTGTERGTGGEDRNGEGDRA